MSSFRVCMEFLSRRSVLFSQKAQKLEGLQSRCGCQRRLCQTGPRTPEKPNEAAYANRVLKRSMALAGVTLLGILGFKRYVELQKEAGRAKKQEVVSTGKPLLGGEWDLIDHNNKPVTSASLQGQWLLLYFGFTHCPDICPEELEKMAAVIEKLDADDTLPKVAPFFITLDPDRDDVTAVGNYVKEFSPRLTGLTGSKEQIERISRAYRIYYSVGPKDEDNDYIVDHSIIMYLIGPDGLYRAYYGRTRTQDDVVSDVARLMHKEIAAQ